MLALLLLCVASACAVPLQDQIAPRPGEKCGYASCTQAEPDKLNVHIVAHTHDDVGWLKTVDQYYYGSRNNIQKAGVQYILDSVVKELWEDARRRFIYVETAFFWKWWTRQSDDVRQKVHTLVRQGRLQFVGGAWSMNDEAASHYQSTVDQFTWGLSKLNETFGECGRPRVGWQIDPFGHSREFASLLAGMGYDGLFLGRIDFQDKTARLKNKHMEMIWRGDDSLGKPSDIFTGVLFNTYSPPPGFCFDVLCDDEPIIDDPDSPMFNVDSRISKFIAYVTEERQRYRTNNVIVTMGGDFTYQDAAMWYHNLDKLIKYTNLKSAKDGLNIKLFYSTPDCYLKAVKDANPVLPIKQDDFFPYASDPTAFWTGYFTSRPTTKYFEREGNDYLQMVKQLQVLAKLEKHNIFEINELKSAMGVMQHHDAVTGTEKEHVAHDYERIMNNAVEDAMIVARMAFNKINQGDSTKSPIFDYERCRLNESRCFTSENSQKFVITVYNPLAWKIIQPIRVPVVDAAYAVYAPNGEEITSQLIEIPEYVKNIPTRSSEATHELVFMAHLHPLGLKSFYVKKTKKTKRDTDDLDFDFNDYWKNVKGKSFVDIKNIENEELNKIGNAYDTFKNEKVIYDQMTRSNVPKSVLENRDIDMLKDKGDNIYVELLEKLIKEAKLESTTRSFSKLEKYPMLNEEEMRMLSDDPAVISSYDEIYIENENVKLRINNSSGETTHIILPDKTIKMKLQFYYWSACYGDNSNTTERSSGAYIFRPNVTTPFPINMENKGVKKGPVVSEFWLSAPEISASVRLYQGLPFLELDMTVGPIPIADKVGKEYVIRYETDVVNNGIFYTDSNGRQMLKRKLNERPQWNLTLAEPVAGNYYPVTNKIFIEDTGTRVSVLTDRSEGGTSLDEGEVELMLHRRLLHDDAFGVGEALNEVANGKGLVARIKQKLFVGNAYVDDVFIKKQTLQFHLQPLVFVSNADNLDLKDWLTLGNCFIGSNELPDGLHLLTLEPWGDKLLVRLENYLEKSNNSTVEVDLGNVFTHFKVKNIQETALAADRSLIKRWEWKTEEEFKDSFNNAYDNYGYINKAKDPEVLSDNGFKVKLAAKQIRTFFVDYDYVEK